MANVEMEKDLLSGYVMDRLINPTRAIRQILSLNNKIWYQNSCKLIPASIANFRLGSKVPVLVDYRAPGTAAHAAWQLMCASIPNDDAM